MALLVRYPCGCIGIPAGAPETDQKRRSTRQLMLCLDACDRAPTLGRYGLTFRTQEWASNQSPQSLRAGDEEEILGRIHALMMRGYQFQELARNLQLISGQEAVP